MRQRSKGIRATLSGEPASIILSWSQKSRAGLRPGLRLVSDQPAANLSFLESTVLSPALRPGLRHAGLMDVGLYSERQINARWLGDVIGLSSSPLLFYLPKNKIT